MAVGMFYKWEDHNHGLEHKCGTCKTVLSSPRAKKTCFGVHEEVCSAYHKTLHFIGASHKCSACSNTRNAHSKRHLEIAEIIQAINCLEGSSSTESPLFNNKRKSRKRDDSKTDSSDDGGMHVGEVDQERETEWDSSSSTLHNDDDGMERKQCWSGGMDNADSRKVAKAERKAAKNQVLFDVISQDDLNKVEKALHPDSEHQTREISKGQGLADNHTIEQNIAYNANTYQWGKLRQGVHAKKMAKNNGGKQRQNTQQDNEILEPIFASLRISTNISKTSKERKSLDSRLRAAILGDLVASENDQAETMQRMAGYWRYVNKRTYNEMVRNNELWDWATGEKLPEIREDVELELDVIEEEDESAGDGTLNREIERQIPEHWDDPGIEFWDESADLTKHGPETLNGLPNPRSPLSPMTSNPLDKGFQGVKDTRVFEKAIRKASPPFKNPPCAPPQPERIALVPVATLNKELQDLLNRFGCLKREVPAPCEEVKKADPPPLVKSVVKFPAKPIVKTLAIHSELDNWRTIQRPKGKKGAKNGPAVVALREQAAVNVLARKLAGGKTFAAMVKKGL